MSRLLSASRIACIRAAKAAVRVQAKLVDSGAVSKKDASPVTIADYAAQVIVSVTLQSILGYGTDGVMRGDSTTTPEDSNGAHSRSSLRAGSIFRMVGEEDATTLQKEGSTLIPEILAALDDAWPRSEVHWGTESDSSTPTTSSSSSGSSASSAGWTAAEVITALSSGGYAGGGTEPYWVLDPIDGTKGFLRRGQYAVGLAYVMHGRPVLGVIACPNLPYPAWPTATQQATSTEPAAAAAAVPPPAAAAAAQRGCIFTALEGHGATMEAMPVYPDAIAQSEASTAVAPDAAAVVPVPAAVQSIRASPLTEGSQLVLAESFEASHSDHAVSSSIASSLGLQASPIRIDSMCKYGLLARGDAHVYLRFPRPGYVENVWDHAPGAILITEAGGCVSDADGLPLDFSVGRGLSNNYGVVASSSPAVHGAVIAAVRKARGKE